MKTFVVFVLSFLIALLLDFVWIMIMGGLYREMAGQLLRSEVFLPATLAFYALSAAALTFFAVRPAANLRKATLLGGFVGLIVYGAYDLTNLATIAGWPLSLTVIDLAWGVVNAAITAALVYSISKKFHAA